MSAPVNEVKLPQVAIRRFASVSDVPAGVWDRLSGDGGLFASHRFVSSYESVEPAPDAGTEVYAAYLGERVIGLLPVWSGLPANGGRYDLVALVTGTCQHTRAADWFPFLTFGTRTGYSNCVAVDPALPEEQRRGVLRALTAAAQDDDHPAVCFPYLTASSAASAVRATPGAQAVLTGADAVITIPDGGFDGYLASLPSKRRRQARHEARMFTDAGLTTELTTLDKASPLLAGMLARRLSKYGASADIGELTAILDSYGQIFGSDALVLLAKADGNPVAFVTLYRWRDDWYGRSWGSVSDGKEAALYFNVAYYQPIKMASQLGIRRFHVGMLAYGAKVRRGAELETRWSVVSSQSPQPEEFASAVIRRNAEVASEFRQLVPDLKVSLPADEA